MINSIKQLAIFNVFELTGSHIAKVRSGCKTFSFFEKTFPTYILLPDNRITKSSYFFQFYDMDILDSTQKEEKWIVFDIIYEDTLLQEEFSCCLSREDMNYSFLRNIHNNKNKFAHYPVPTYIVYNLEYDGEGEDTESLITFSKIITL